jgi:alkylation response protein AidB-like acyl-CoA dehydrogenase
MRFRQEPPALDNQYADDRVLKAYLDATLPDEVRAATEDTLHDLGALAGGELYALQQDDRTSEPTLTQWGPWGARIDRIEVTDLWTRAEEVAVDFGLTALPYAQPHGRWSRVYQMALAHLFIPSTDMYGCPLAMTDGAASALLASGNEALVDQVVPHLTSRDPETFWTSGQWMTELTGGSDVGRTQTTARQAEDGTWRLTGRKWFTSAITANMALALARPEGNPEGGKGLALFYVPIRRGDGSLYDGIRVNRLKDKLGTRKLPTAELDLDDVRAQPVAELKNGTRHIAPMLNVTRLWNAVTSVAYMRRGIALARDYATKREAFGDPLIEHPLHRDTLADLQATYEGAFHLTFRLAELLGQQEAGALDAQGQQLLRIMTPIAKLLTAKQAVSVSSEVVEAFGGAGYVEDTGIPALLRDTQVLPIWEGTTNVLALDALRALKQAGTFDPLRQELARCAQAVETPTLTAAVEQAQEAHRHAEQWLGGAIERGMDAIESGVRRFALTIGKALSLALLARHGQWAIQHEQDGRPAAAAERLMKRRVDHIATYHDHGAYVLVWDFNCPTLYECHAEGSKPPSERPEEEVSPAAA